MDSFAQKIIESIRKQFRSEYKCPICGKESSESQDIFDCLYNHIYNKGDNDNKDNKDNVADIENK